LRFLHRDPTSLHLPYGGYAIDKRGGGGVFYHVLSTNDAIAFFEENRQLMPNLFVCESMAVNDAAHMVCNGEVMIYKDYGVWAYKGFVNIKSGRIVREAALMVSAGQLPSGIRLIRSRHQVPDLVFDELWSKGILHSAVEFSIYKKRVGLKKQHLLFWEIRRY
jgi:hypothetical protein